MVWLLHYIKSINITSPTNHDQLMMLRSGWPQWFNENDWVTSPVVTGLSVSPGRATGRARTKHPFPGSWASKATKEPPGLLAVTVNNQLNQPRLGNTTRLSESIWTLNFHKLLRYSGPSSSKRNSGFSTGKLSLPISCSRTWCGWPGKIKCVGRWAGFTSRSM